MTEMKTGIELITEELSSGGQLEVSLNDINKLQDDYIEAQYAVHDIGWVDSEKRIKKSIKAYVKFGAFIAANINQLNGMLYALDDIKERRPEWLPSESSELQREGE